MQDSWKSDGDCEKCRRAKYCKKQCKASFLRCQHLLREAYKKYKQEVRNGKRA